MNPFTTPRPVPWLKELEKNRRTSQIMQKVMEKPTPTQAKELSLLMDKRGKK